MTTEPEPSAQIGRYRILSTIGTGGMGCVYRARMEGPAGASKNVALKVIHAHLALDDDFVLMFLDETRIAMALSHRNIVQTFDAGRAAERYFMVMELMTGCSLRTLLDRLRPGQRLPLDIALFIGREVSAALAYAHRFRPDERGPGERGQAGVVHRDVSPSNVLLSAEGDVKLADFGVAKAAGRLYVTSANLIRGKLQYMAPEQATGHAEPRSDLHALGAVLYEMLTGAPARQVVGLDELKLPRRIAPPSQLRPGLSPELDAVILACLAPDPAARPAGADEVRQVLAAASFQIQLSTETRGLDPHMRLKRYLEAQGLLADPAAAAAAARPQAPGRLAQAVLEQARALETNPELDVSPELSESISDISDISGISGISDITDTTDVTDTTDITDHDVVIPPADGLPDTAVDASTAPEATAPEATAPDPAQDLVAEDEPSISASFDTATTNAETAPHHLGLAPPPAHTRRWWPVLAVAAAVVLLLLGGGLIWSTGTEVQAPLGATSPRATDAAAAATAHATDATAAATARATDAAAAATARTLDLAAASRAEDAAASRAEDAAASRAEDAAASRAEAPAAAIPTARHTAPRIRAPAPPRRPRAFGLLDINAIPWARVYVDGRYRGETPREDLRLRAGVHKLKLVSRGGLTRTIPVRIRANQRRRMVIDLRAKPTPPE